MKFFVWIALIFGGSLLAWFLWRKVQPQNKQADNTDNRNTGTITTADGNLLAFNYKRAPEAGLLKPMIDTNKKQSIGINSITIIE